MTASDEDRTETAVPLLVGLSAYEARRIGNDAGLVVTAGDPDGPPFGALILPGNWLVVAQHPPAGTTVRRGDLVVIELFDLGGGGGDAGDREPREPTPPAGVITFSLDEPLEDLWPESSVGLERAQGAGASDAGRGSCDTALQLAARPAVTAVDGPRPRAPSRLPRRAPRAATCPPLGP